MNTSGPQAIIRVGISRFKMWGSPRGIKRLKLPVLGNDIKGFEGLEIEKAVPSCPGQLLDELGEFLGSLLQGREPKGAPALDLSDSSAFARAVLLEVRNIRWGSTRSYGWIAERIGKPGCARAVGGALSRNPLPLLVPCHRVVRCDGSTGGFSGGEGWKEWLIGLEAD